MKIGILTFHRAHNYGAVLQCYALQEVLRSMGHEVDVIDYRQPEIEKTYNHWSIITLVKRLVKFWNLKSYVLLIYEEIRRKLIFDSFKDAYLNIRHKCDAHHIPLGYDVYMVGSDQLFTTGITSGLDFVYSGQFARDKHSKLVGYAISSNVISIQEIGKKRWQQIANRFDALSMREKTLTDSVWRLSNVRFPVCVDPTLLTIADTWNRMPKLTVEDEYVVMYEVRRFSKDNNMLRHKTEELVSHLHHIPIVDLSSCRFHVEEWVNYIRNAKCVVTSSFHATVFALIFKRPLYVFKLGDGGDYRYTDLLEYVGLSQCIKEVNDSLVELPEIDFETVGSSLDQYKNESMAFLYNTLK